MSHDDASTTARELRNGRVEDSETMVRVLAHAFEDDPVMAFVFPHQPARLRGLEQMFRLIFVPEAIVDDECWTTGDHAGVALWAPVGKEQPGLVEHLRLLPLVVRIFGRHTPRALRILAFMEAHIPEPPHAHLHFLGTEPQHQGEGVGSLLLRRTLSRLDQEGTPAYLEATSPRNRALYLRHGFVDLGQMHLPGGGPVVWRMWRDPA